MKINYIFLVEEFFEEWNTTLIVEISLEWKTLGGVCFGNDLEKSKLIICSISNEKLFISLPLLVFSLLSIQSIAYFMNRMTYFLKNIDEKVFRLFTQMVEWKSKFIQNSIHITEKSQPVIQELKARNWNRNWNYWKINNNIRIFSVRNLQCNMYFTYLNVKVETPTQS